MPALVPPVEPMLARLARVLPAGGGHRYEPKWDGFRCIAFRHATSVDLRSRNQRPLARYFPEVVDALLSLPHGHLVLDGELIVVRGGQRFDFGALMSRLHPAASRVALLARTTPAIFVAFDLLAIGDDVLLDRPFAARRRCLEAALRAAPPTVRISPTTCDPAVAQRWLHRYSGNGIDGVVAKDPDLPYEPGRRAMTKVKLERTADCVVGGFRWWPDDRPAVSSLLLGLWDEGGDRADDGGPMLRHIGVVTTFTRPLRERLVRDVIPRATSLAGHPWEHGFALEGGPMGRLKGAAGRWTPDLELDWVPLVPEMVCEVAYDQVDGRRLRHPARWRRWRPDRTARSCSIEQLDQPAEDLGAVLAP